jgi:capsular polysaccharide biosynthesis protein
MNRRLPTILPALLRYGWLIVLCMVLVAALSSVIARSQVTEATAEAVLVVPAGEDDGSPGNAQQAVTLAGTYTALIPVDGAVLRSVGAAVGRRAEDVEGDLMVTNDDRTSVLRVRFVDPDELLALTASRAATTAITSLPRYAVRPVRDARVVTVAGTAAAASIPIGAILGLFLGLALVFAFERLDPRIDDAEELEFQLGSPTTTYRELTPPRVAALLDRWHALAGRDGPSRVTLLAGTPGDESLVGPLADRLIDLATSEGVDVGRRRGSGSAITSDVQFVVGGAPGRESASEALAAEGDLTVIVMRPGRRVAKLRPGLSALSQFGVAPDWGILVDPKDLAAVKPVPTLAHAA